MAATLKILALADGFGDSQICPSWYPEFHKWPTILKLMTKDIEVIDFCRYGAGNEYMVSCLRHNYQVADLVFIQWAIPYRLDLILAHERPMLDEWIAKINSDDVYKNNFQDIGQDRWWMSSGSTVDWVKDYRNKFISRRQHQTRSKIWAEYAHGLLKSKKHGFLLAYDGEYLQDADIDPDVWVWHEPWKGMHDWRFHSHYSDLDLGVTQPIPLIQFDFIKEFIMPKFDLPWRSEREIQAVESMLVRKYNQYKDQKPT